MYVIERHLVCGGTDNIAWLDMDGDFSEYEQAMVFDSYKDAERYCKPDGDPNNLNPNISEVRWDIKKYPYLKCPVCGEEWSPDDLVQTCDCHGIPYRRVCPDCYSVVMRGFEYDGAYYDNSDENIDGEEY